MKITIEEPTYYAVTDCRILAVQGEANTRSVSITHPAVSGATQYFLRVQLPESLIYDLPLTEGTVLLPASVTGFAGIVPIQWVAKNQTGSVIAKSQIIPSIVKPSISGDASALPTPEELMTKYDAYLNTMRDIQQDVTKTGETVRSDADRAESSVSRAEALLQSMQGLTIGERVRLYVDAETGSDTNNGKATTTAVQTLDRALVLANAYQQAIICLKNGQTYTARDKSNEYGMGIQLYHRTLRFEAYGTDSEPPKITNSLFAYNSNLEFRSIDLCSNSGSLTLYNTICSFESCTIYRAVVKNSLAKVSLCNIQREWIQSGGFSVISNAKSIYCHIGNIQANEGARIDYSGFGIGGWGSDGTGILSIDGVPENLQTAKNVAEDSVSVKTVYVNAVTGSDSRDGTQANPVKTLSEAFHLTQYARKAVLYLAAGTYTIPDKSLTLLGRDVRIYGDSAAATTIQGNLICENSFLYLSKVTMDNTDSDAANPSSTAIISQFNGNVRLANCVIHANSKNAVGVSDLSNLCCSNTTFQGNAQYAVYVTGQGDAKIYYCTNQLTTGAYSGGNSMVRITQNDSESFSYVNANNGMVFVNGQQVLPKATAVSSAMTRSADETE